MDKLSCVYVHVFPNGKMYFGITSQLPHQRWGENGVGYKNQPILWRAIQKYGWENIEHIILYDNISYIEAQLKEQCLIKKYGTNEPDFGYNLTLGGEGVLGYKYTAEQLKNHKYWLGKHHSEDTKKKLSEMRKGTRLTEETKRKLSESRRGKPSPFKGKHLSEESKQKISLHSKGLKRHTIPHTAEARQKISESSRGKVISQETREKLRQKAIEQWERFNKEKNKIEKEKN